MKQNNINFTNKDDKGFFQDPLLWMVNHSVSANLIMVILLGLGFILMLSIKKEVFPDFQSDKIDILVIYPGASTSNLEKAVAIPIEYAIANVDNIGDVTSEITDERVVVTAEVLNSSSFDTAYRSIENKVSSITSFPSDMPRPIVSKRQNDRPLMYLTVYSKDTTKADLKRAVEVVREVFSQDPETGLISIPGDEDYEIQVEVPESNLRKYQLTLEDIGKAIASSGVDLSTGTIRSSTEKVELRFNYYKDLAYEFNNIVIKNGPNGVPLYLKDIATITDALDENVDVDVTIDNKLATLFIVSAKEGQTPNSVSKAVNKAVEKAKKVLPPGIDIMINYDSTSIFNDRAFVLMKEGGMGVLLVVLILSIFLDWRLAFWTSFSIPISFFGAFLILTPIMAPLTGFSINIISLFAFIIVLGIVIDDAIVVGENVFHHKEMMPSNPKLATANGVKEVASSAFFSIFTNILAFLPLAFLPGMMGKFFRQIPIVIVFVLIVSLFESLFILPARITFKVSPHSRNVFARVKGKFNDVFDMLVNVYYGRLLSKVVTYRYIVLGIIISTLLIFIGYMKSGRMGVVLMPEAENDIITFSAIFPANSTLEKKSSVRRVLVDNALEILNSKGGTSIYKSVEADIIDTELNVRIFLQPASMRAIDSKAILNSWENKNGELIGLQSYSYSSSISMPGGNAQITMNISHSNSKTLAKAINDITDYLYKYSYVTHVENDNSKGYLRYNFNLNEIGYALGLNPYYIGSQVRNFVYGYKAIEQVKDRNTQRVMVRLPKEEINSSTSIKKFVIKTPYGKYVPLQDIVDFYTNLSDLKINRLNYKRNISVLTYVSPDDKSSEVLTKFLNSDLPSIQKMYPGLEYSLGGRQKEMLKVGKALLVGTLVTLVAIYTALAMFFDSYTQPLIIMIAIPFGFIGAIVGHIFMGFSLSIPSMFGLLALSGIVVNASMIIIYFTNMYKNNSSVSSDLAIIEVSKRRFRPIFLTAITAFLGVLPTIMSSSSEVAFLRPIAVAIGFGVIFSTIITLICTPVFYLVLEDIKGIIKKKRIQQQVSI